MAAILVLHFNFFFNIFVLTKMAGRHAFVLWISTFYKLRTVVLREKSKYKKVSVLPIWKVKSNVSSILPFVRVLHDSCFSLKNGLRSKRYRLYFPYGQYSNLFTFRLLSQHCLRSTLHIFHCFEREPFAVRLKCHEVWRAPIEYIEYYSWVSV